MPALARRGTSGEGRRPRPFRLPSSVFPGIRDEEETDYDPIVMNLDVSAGATYKATASVVPDWWTPHKGRRKGTWSVDIASGREP